MSDDITVERQRIMDRFTQLSDALNAASEAHLEYALRRACGELPDVDSEGLTR